MTVVKTVKAGTLAVGDAILYEDNVVEILAIDDTGLGDLRSLQVRQAETVFVLVLSRDEGVHRLIQETGVREHTRHGHTIRAHTRRPA